MRTTWGLSARPSRRALISIGLVVACLIGLSVWRLQGDAKAQDSSLIVTATRGPIVVTVGGVGQIVDGLWMPSASSNTSASGSSASAPSNTVVAGASGTVARVLVATGQQVAAGQAIAVIDDTGTAARAASQAGTDLQTALLELPPSTRGGAIRIAERNVALAKQRLARVRGPAHPADLSTAHADVQKALADLAALLRPPLGPTAEAITAARTAVSLAEQRLEKLTGPRDPVAVATAKAELAKAEADLEALVRSDRIQPVTKAEIDSGRAAIAAARLKLAKVQGPPDPTDVSAVQLELERARAELATLLRPPVAPSKEAIAAAQRALAAAKAKRKRVQGGVPPADVTAARLDLLRATSELRTLRITMRRAASGSPSPTADLPVRLGLLKIQSAQNRVAAAHAAEALLEVYSPWAGTVSAVLVTPGAHVDPTTPIAAVADLDNLAVNVNLSEFDVAEVKVGMHAVVSVDALGGELFPGTVAQVAYTGSNTSGVVTYPVSVALEDTEGLKPGMNTSVRITVAKKANVVRVPLEAVRTDDQDRAFVTVLDESGQETEVQVTTGLESNEQVEIVKGIEAGARVVLPDPAAAQEGA